MVLTTAVVVMEANMNKILRRLGLKDDYGYCDPSIAGFIVLWTAYGYGFYITILALINRFS